MEYVCKYCSKVFSRSFNLKRHVFAMHTNPSSKSENTEKFICQLCSRSYLYKRSLFAHMRVCQSDERKPQIFNYSCCLCNMNDIQNILEHYSVIHDVDVSITNFIFDNQQEFESWKDDIEKSTISKYIQNCKREYTNKIMYYYRCHRNGFHKSKSKNIRNIKRMGSSKINGHCPSKITATISKETGQVRVDYLPTHIGHTMDIRRIPLKKADRDLLAAKISQKIPYDEILQDIRDNIEVNSCNRLHLITRQDLVNIERSFNLNNEAVRSSKPIIRTKKSKRIENKSIGYEQNNIIIVVKKEGQEEECEEQEEECEEQEEECEEHEDEHIEEEEQADLCNSEFYTQEVCESDASAIPDIINKVKKRLMDQFHSVINMATSLEQCALIESVLIPLESEFADMVSSTTNLNATEEL